MLKKWIMVLMTLTLTAGMALPAAARETGSLTVQLDYPPQVSKAGSVSLTRVAAMQEGSFRLKDSYGGGVLRQEEAVSPELAQWLAEATQEGEINRILDADGKTVFSGLEPGLYLLMQEEAPVGYACANPFLVPVPLYGQWDILADPKTCQRITESPQTGDSFSPLLWAMLMVLSGVGLWLWGEKLGNRKQ